MAKYNLILEDGKKKIEPAPAVGATSYLELSDTDSSYTGKAGYVPKVNTGEDALELVKLDAGSVGVNVETLAADKTLLSTDDKYQWLDCDGANRIVFLPGSSIEGDNFIIRNYSAYNVTYYITLKQSTTELTKINNGSEVDIIYTGSKWIEKNNQITDFNKQRSTAFGFCANSSDRGTAIGHCSNGSVNGSAIGLSANGSTAGAAVGSSANGSTYGAAVGNSANGSTYGCAMGYLAYAPNYGVAIGKEAYNSNKGVNTVAIGAYSKVERPKELSFSHSPNINNKSCSSIIGIQEILDTVNGVWAEQFLDAASARLTLSTNCILNFELFYSAYTLLGQKAWNVRGAIQSINDVVTFLGTPTKTVIGENGTSGTWDIQVTADDTNDSLKLEFYGNAEEIRRGGSFYLTDLKL